MSSPLRSGAHRLKAAVGSRQLGLRALGAIGGVRREWLVTPTHDVCIDGYPRSGNSFAVRVFQTWNPEARVGHHVHLAAQIQRAVRFGVPVAVLLRDPIEAASSHILYSGRALSTAAALWSYRRFYEGVAPIAEEVAIVPFEDLTGDPTFLVTALNRRFGTAFGAGEQEGPARRRFADEVLEKERRYSDSASGDRLRAEERRRMRREIVSRVEREPGLGATRTLHEQLLATCARQGAHPSHAG